MKEFAKNVKGANARADYVESQTLPGPRISV